MRNRIKQNIADTSAEYPRGFWMLMGINIINFLGNNLIFPFFALYISKKFSASMTQVGLLFTFFTISRLYRFDHRRSHDRSFRPKEHADIQPDHLCPLQSGHGFCTITFFLLWCCPDRWDHRLSRRAGRSGDDRRPGSRRKACRGIRDLQGRLQYRSGDRCCYWWSCCHTLLLALFIADAVLSSICAFLVYFFLKETKPDTQPGQAKESLATTFAGYLEVIKDKGYMLFLGAAFLAWLVAQNFRPRWEYSFGMSREFRNPAMAC